MTSLVVKVVNYTILPNDDKHMEWEDAVGALDATRSVWKRRWTDIDNRQAVESNGEMA